MLLEEYVAKTEELAELTGTGDFKGALKILQALLATDLPDLDKSLMWVNAAIVYDKMNRTENALRCYDKAISLEKPHRRFFAAQKKAAYLANNGRGKESLLVYESLLERGDLTLAERDRITKNIALVKQHL